MRRYLVTGGSGFIGSALVRRLIANGHEVLNLDLGTYAAVPGALEDAESDPRYRLVEGSIADRSLVSGILSDFDPSRIVNLAAETHVDRSIDAPAPFIETNVVGAATLLEVATEHWSGLARSDAADFRYVHVSTDEVFGSLESGLADEKSPYRPQSPYAASKAASDHLTMAWHNTFGLPAIITNCSNNYGPYQFPEKLIPLTIIRSLMGLPIPVYGDGLQVRDWIHVDDHCEGLNLVCDKGKPGRTYVIGARSTISNIDVLKMICGALDAVAPRADGSSHVTGLEHVEDRPGHDRRYALDPSSVEALGFTPHIELSHGIPATVQWYVENRQWWEAIVEETYDTSRLGVAG